MAQITVEVEEEVSGLSCHVCGFASRARTIENRKCILKRHIREAHPSTVVDKYERSVVETVEGGKVDGVLNEEEADEEMELPEVEEEEYDGDEEGDGSRNPSWMTVLCKTPGVTILSTSVHSGQ